MQTCTAMHNSQNHVISRGPRYHPQAMSVGGICFDFTFTNLQLLMGLAFAQKNPLEGWRVGVRL